MKKSTQRNLRNRKRRIEYRLRDRDWCDQEHPMFGVDNVHYEVDERPLRCREAAERPKWPRRTPTQKRAAFPES